MVKRSALLLLGLCAMLSAADPPRWFEAKLEDMEGKVRLVRDRDEMARLLGSDLDGEYILVELELRPLYGAKIELDRADFVLRSYRDNDSSVAQSPHQIAGEAVLVLGEGETTSVGIFSNSTHGIPVGGAPGTGTRPRRIGGDDPAVGNGAQLESGGTISQGRDEAPTGLLGRLAQSELPMGEMQDVIRGYLYFQISAKQKPKHLTLTYEGVAGEFKIWFK